MNPRLAEVAALMLRLGATAFGGPAAHIALLHDETVRRRAWLTDAQFLDLLGATNLIPGPNSTEMAIHVGHQRAGARGLVLAGVCFILPAALIVGLLAWAYVTWGTTPAVGWLLYGIKPVIIALLVQALWSLCGKALSGVATAGVGAAAAVLYLAGANELALLAAGGALLWLVRVRRNGTGLAALAPLAWGGLPAGVATGAAAGSGYGLGALFLTFLKIGSVLYGSGYVLLAFLRSSFVEGQAWLTETQLLDAVAIGQVTPGPVFTTATFVGYLLEGVPGAVLATLGIFLPSFLFVALTARWIPRLRASVAFSAVLDGVNAASLGLMAAVTLQLGRAALVDPLTVALAVAAVLVLRYTKLNSTWLIAGGALAGGLRALLG